MPTFYEIPTSSTPQSFSITLAGVVYNLRLIFCGASGPGGTDIVGQDVQGAQIDTNNIGGWILDISNADNTPIVCGIPLITGLELLYQYVYLNIGGAIVATTDGDPNLPPTFDNMGSASHLLFVTFP